MLVYACHLLLLICLSFTFDERWGWIVLSQIPLFSQALLREWTADRCTGVKFVSVSTVYGMAWEGGKVIKGVISYNG